MDNYTLSLMANEGVYNLHRENVPHRNIGSRPHVSLDQIPFRKFTFHPNFANLIISSKLSSNSKMGNIGPLLLVPPTQGLGLNTGYSSYIVHYRTLRSSFLSRYPPQVI